NNYVASALIADGFEYLGLLEDVELDYLEPVTGNWSLGSICSTNELVEQIAPNDQLPVTSSK
ncbi:MAG: hypothetical protein ACKPA7_22805, partial [Sphaerospermopsis kisseleviana]